MTYYTKSHSNTYIYHIVYDILVKLYIIYRMYIILLNVYYIIECILYY